MMKPTDPNKQLYRDMQEEPEKYSDQELEAMMDEVDQMADADEAWQQFCQQHMSPVSPMHTWRKMAAILISIITISGIAFAAVHFVRNHEGRSAQTEPQPTTVETRMPDTHKLPADTTAIAQPVVFDNVALDSILPQIARHYGYTVNFRNEQPKSLRLFVTWNPQDSIQKVTEKMNLFEQFHIVLEEQTIIIE